MGSPKQDQNSNENSFKVNIGLASILQPINPYYNLKPTNPHSHALQRQPPSTDNSLLIRSLLAGGIQFLFKGRPLCPQLPTHSWGRVSGNLFSQNIFKLGLKSPLLSEWFMYWGSMVGSSHPLLFTTEHQIKVVTEPKQTVCVSWDLNLRMWFSDDKPAVKFRMEDVQQTSYGLCQRCTVSPQGPVSCVF